MNSRIFAFACVLPFCVNLCLAENWPGFRGPRGDGTSLETNVPTKWDATNNVAWKVAIPGKGHSSPVIWNDRIFLTTALEESKERVLLCLDKKNGAKIWQQTVLTAPLEAKNGENSYASATPVTDGKSVYVTFLGGSNVVVAAYDFSGKQLWLVRPGTFYSQWGFSHTPRLFEDKVIVDCDSKGENFVVALSQTDGRTVWKIKRENPTQSYSAPFIAKMAGRIQMIISGNKAITSYDPSTGKVLWVVNGPSEDSVMTPVYNEKANIVLCGSSWPKRKLVAIRPDGEGNVTQTKVVWSTETGAPYVPSPISVGDWFFTSSYDDKDKSTYCFEAATGNILWHQKMALHHSSPVSANGLVYSSDDEGVMTVFKAAPAFELVSRNELGEKTYASPAISDGQIFLRGFENLYCIGVKK